jgi:tRNA/rRNA methyltransferase
MAIENCRVVLVRPQQPGNVGAAARALRNLGLSDLALVAPEADPLGEEARRFAAHGAAVLERARVVADLGEAVADCVLVAATSAKSGGAIRRQGVGSPEAILPRLLAASDRPVALVFGPESTGLLNAEVSRCHYLITIPADPAYPVLNLAQAVAVCLYELRRQWLRQTAPAAAAEPPAPFADQERMFDALRAALAELHFLYGEKADTLFHAVRHLIGRAQPTPTEVRVLFGLARQIRWHVRRHPRRPGDEGGVVN